MDDEKDWRIYEKPPEVKLFSAYDGVEQMVLTFKPDKEWSTPKSSPSSTPKLKRPFEKALEKAGEEVGSEHDEVSGKQKMKQPTKSILKVKENVNIAAQEKPRTEEEKEIDAEMIEYLRNDHFYRRSNWDDDELEAGMEVLENFDPDVREDETGKMKFTVRRYDPVQTAEDVVPPPPLAHKTPQQGDDEDDGPNGLASTLDSNSVSSSFYSTGALQRQDVAQRGRVFARRHKRRLIFKDGKSNIALSNISKRKRRFLGDIFSTFLDMKWRWVMVVFTLSFLISWLVFALIWWLIAFIHKDHEHIGDENWDFCMVEVYDFTTALLFSVETQHTIGYGSRSMNTKCPEAVLLLMLQSCTGVFLQSVVTGIIFAKLSRPKGRSHTLMFSKTAVICQRDGKYCLLFRVADMRSKSHIVGATLRATMVRNRITKEGELLPLGAIPFEVQAETCFSDGNIFLMWPVTVTHTINEESPFWEMSAEQLLSERFEIVMFLEGTVESSGMSCQVRTSYLPSEIQWGYRLAPLFTYQKENGQYRIDYTVFHNTHPVRMPECSAKAFDEGDYDESAYGVHGTTSDNYHTENCGVRKASMPNFKHRLLRRNTTSSPVNGGLSRLDESDSLGGPGGDVRDEKPNRRRRGLRKPAWMNGLVHFWSSSDLTSRSKQDDSNSTKERSNNVPHETSSVKQAETILA